MLKKLGILLGLAAVAAASWFMFEIASVRTRVTEAQGYAEDEQWRQARHLLRQALRWNPSDAEANLLMAESLVRDELLTAPGDAEAGLKVVDDAISHLSRIAEDSPYASDAQVQLGRLKATQKLQPGAALNHFEKAIELDANNQEAYFRSYNNYPAFATNNRNRKEVRIIIYLDKCGV